LQDNYRVTAGVLKHQYTIHYAHVWFLCKQPLELLQVRLDYK